MALFFSQKLPFVTGADKIVSQDLILLCKKGETVSDCRTVFEEAEKACIVHPNSDARYFVSADQFNLYIWRKKTGEMQELYAQIELSEYQLYITPKNG